MRQRLKMFGFEIEGEFHRDILPRLNKEGVFKSDGSIHCCSSCEHLLDREFNSKACKVGSLINTKKFFEKLQEDYDKKMFHFNASCGFHIHISTYKFPTELISMDFVKYFYENLQDKFPEVIEKRGGNRYCRKDIKIEHLMRNGTQDRYLMVNTWPSYLKHKTIEIRIFPTEEPMKMYEYLKFTVKTFKQFIKMPLEIEAVYELKETKNKEVEVFNLEVNKKLCVNY